MITRQIIPPYKGDNEANHPTIWTKQPRENMPYDSRFTQFDLMSILNRMLTKMITCLDGLGAQRLIDIVLKLSVSHYTKRQ